jgi:acetyl esterase/lipase
MGHSAGAHLAALVTTDRRFLDEAGKSLSIVRGTVCLDTGDYDMVSAVETDERNHREMVESAFGTDPAVWADVSPINHAVAGLAPFDLLHVTSNRKQQQAQVFSDRLRAVGVTTTVYEVMGASHEDVNRNMGLAGDPATVQVMGFLDSVRQGKAAARARPGRKAAAGF